MRRWGCPYLNVDAFKYNKVVSPFMPFRSKPRLTDPGTENWYRSMSRRSRITADVNYRRLRAFCVQMKVTPARIVQQARRQVAVRDLLSRFVDQEVQKGRAAWYIHSSLIAVKSWLAFNDRPLTLKVEIPSNTVSARRENERVPTLEEMRSVMLAAKPHERLVVALMAFSGLRPGAIGSYLGDDGLRLKDLPELHYPGDGCRTVTPALHVKGRAIFEKVPTRLRIRTTSSKARHQYLTFVSEEGCRYTSQYLEQRMAQGEELSPDSGLAHPRFVGKSFVRSLNIGARVRRVFKAAGLVDESGETPRPYVLRRYFLNRCLEAQSKAGIPDRFVEFWAGHRGDVTAQYYTTGLPNLPSSLIEEMRGAYRRCEPFLSTLPTQAERDEREVQTRRLLLKVAGFTEEELKEMDISTLPDAELARMVEERVGHRSAVSSIERVFPTSEVGGMLANGWVFVSPLGLDQAVLRQPNGNVLARVSELPGSRA